MLDAVKRYATLILILHAMLLGLVILVVLGVAHEVRVSARNEAQTQSQERLELVANQTARGLQSHYESIFSDLNVILHDDTVTPATLPAEVQPSYGTLPTPPPRGGRRGPQPPARGGGGLALRVYSGPVAINAETLNTLWRQLKGRVSQLFLVDIPDARVLTAFPENTHASALSLTRENISWIRSLKDSQMSGFNVADSAVKGEKTGYHLIGIPAVNVPPQFLQRSGPLNAGGRGGQGGGSGYPGGGGGGTGPGGPGGGPGAGPGGPGGGPGGGEGPGMPARDPNAPPQFAVVVVVPIDQVREQFIDPLNEDEAHQVNAILVNDAGQVLASSNLHAAGTNLLDQLGDQPDIKADLSSLIAQSNGSPLVINKSFHVGSTEISPQLFVSAPLEVPSGHHWTVLISSPVAEADRVVNQLFGSAVQGVLFICLSVTAILVSTASFLIRSRVKLERTRHELLTRELEQARQIQLAWLPDMKSVPAGIEISAVNLPASHISGDFYNWFELPRHGARGAGGTADDGQADARRKVAIVIGDVTGHGMAAAFLMATTQLLVRMTLLRYQDAGRCLREVNQQLCAQGFQGQFVTMLVMVLDPLSNTIQIANAGHPTPLIEARGGEGEFRSLAIEPQLVLGVNPDEEYQSEQFSVEPGASVILYTDGVVEAENTAGTQYGVENLIKLLDGQNLEESVRHGVGGGDIAPAGRIRAILEDVKRFCNHRELLDDVTLVALRTSPAAVESYAGSGAN